MRAIFPQVQICDGKVSFPYIVELMNTRMSSPYLDESIYLFLRKLGLRTIIIRVRRISQCQLPVPSVLQDVVAACVWAFIATYIPPSLWSIPCSDLPRTIFVLAYQNISLLLIGLGYNVRPMMTNGVLL